MIGTIIGTHLAYGCIPCLTVRSARSAEECKATGHKAEWGINHYSYTRTDSWGHGAREAFALTEEEYDSWLAKLNELRVTQSQPDPSVGHYNEQMEMMK